MPRSFGQGRSFLEFRQFVGADLPNATKPAKVRVEASVRIAGALTLPQRRATKVRARLPRTAAHHALRVFARIRRAARVGFRALLVISRTVNILAPFRDVSI